MARLSNIKRIIKEQLPSDVQKWVDQLLIPINNAISQFTYALTNQLTISDNMLGAVKTFTLSSDQFPFTFSHGLTVQPKIMFIGQINDTSANPAIFTAAPFVQWTIGQNGATCVIQTITGLDPAKQYSVVLVILAS